MVKLLCCEDISPEKKKIAFIYLITKHYACMSTKLDREPQLDSSCKMCALHPMGIVMLSIL